MCVLSASRLQQLGTLIMVLRLTKRETNLEVRAAGLGGVELKAKRTQYVGLECTSERGWNACLSEARPTSLSIIMPMPRRTTRSR